jgi:phosphotransferase system enzyme I (PtsP)
LWQRLRNHAGFTPLGIVRTAKGIIRNEEWGLIAALHDARADCLKLARDEIEACVYNDLSGLLAEIADKDRAESGRRTLLLGIDQAEEMSTLSPEEDSELEELLSWLLTLPNDLDLRLVVMARDDGVDATLERLARVGLPHEQVTSWRLGRMPATRFRDIVAGPATAARRAGWPLHVDDTLVDALAMAAGGSMSDIGDALPILALALHRMVARRHAPDGRITVKPEEARGFIETAVEEAAKEAVKSANAGSDDLRRLVIPRLATWDPKAGPDGAAKRQVASDADLFADSRAGLRRLADALVTQRLLTRSRTDGGAAYEIAHEALLRVPPLSQLIYERRERFEQARILEIEAREWNMAGRIAGRLGRAGDRLHEAQKLLADEDFGPDLADREPSVTDYLAACATHEQDPSNSRRIIDRISRTHAFGGLRRLKAVMEEPVSAQERLDKIVVLIAANMVAEVCSIYVLRVDATLELYATKGLNQDAVHHTMMNTNEGLVGLVANEANPINLSDAQGHPAYSYRPETGEEIYHSFLGVPILRAGNTLGVLVVQNRGRRTYSEEEVEALQTTAMVLTEMIASGELSALAPPGAEPAVRRTLKLQGSVLNEGIALGHVVLHEPRVIVTNFIADDVTLERNRLDTAITLLRTDLDAMLEHGDVAEGGEHREVLEAYRMFAHDRGWVDKLEEAVLTGLTAEAAVERVQSDTRARMLRQIDPYLRERLHDLDDLANRLMRQLLGRDHAPAREHLPENAIVVARSMGPAALLDYDRKRLRALVLEEGGPTSHVAIIARALGIAAVGEVSNAIGLVDSGDAVIVDGTSGEVHIRPSPELEAHYIEKVQVRARRQLQYQALRDKPCVTRDGIEVSLLLNAGLLVDLPHVEETGASGIGLFRTELQFMVSGQFPRTGEQLSLYRSVLDAADGRPVTFRTLDVGGDKVLPYMRVVEEENPALGWRAIRLGLDRPALLRSQIRALLRAASGRTLRLMFPMIAAIHEFDEAKDLVERELTYLRRQNHSPPDRVEVGTMVEVPSLLYQLDGLLDRADFLSVGSNDLAQFLFAADRQNPRVSTRFDDLSAPMLHVLGHIAERAEAHGKPVTLCGEMASKTVSAMALIALGYRHLSLVSSAVGPVKAMALELDVRKAESLVKTLIAHKDSGGSIRDDLVAFAAAEGIPL